MSHLENIDKICQTTYAINHVSHLYNTCADINMEASEPK